MRAVNDLVQQPQRARGGIIARGADRDGVGAAVDVDPGARVGLQLGDGVAGAEDRLERAVGGQVESHLSVRLFKVNRLRGVGGCPGGPSKQAFAQKIDKILSTCCQLFMNFQKFPHISDDFDDF